MDLTTQSCIPCQEGAPLLTEAELQELLPQLPGWSVVDHHHLQRRLNFPDFQSALDWVNAAGAICEAQGHHAEFTLGWGHAEAVIYTHKVNGLTQADAVLAAKFNMIGSGAG
ncbi:MAG: 4a-hydroxytetrahydrobiopterin dehydratase [Synechococcus sp.]|jgi:4a-hydroxytetrahydrobiopterin dehydratase|nr:4a-hydroxytetrahydrobiopterin dehydratase [Synechococcus sp.]